jgi:SAM-dependent methyltransferase
VGWFATQLAAPFLSRLSPGSIGDWVTDRGARRPSGPLARSTYGDPLYHYPNFRVILDELSPGPDDRLLEVGCGGGAMLEKALSTGCTAAGIDHSLDMVRLSRAANSNAIRDGRLTVVAGTADALPFRDGAFTRAAMTGVLGFLRDPVRALAEIRRTLAPGGRLVVLGSDPRLRGTPAAPEPMASRLHFYEDEAFEQLGRDAGFDRVAIIQRDLEEFARDAGVPDEIVPLFAGDTAFLVAEKV